jgi:3'(2'), 5'-bisphosphate nucleotidase
MAVDITWSLLQHLADLARRAGAAILACERPGCETKADGSPVTAADRLAQDVICAGLQRLDDTIPIIAEESDLPEPNARHAWRWYWLVDPLDGTKEFLAGRPDYTVNIALIEDGVPVMGVVSAPALGEMYFAARGLGTWRQVANAAPVRLIANCLASDAGVRVIESRSHPSPALEEFLRSIAVTERIQLGSSLKFCRLAEGRADCYPRFGPTMSWDVAAGDCVFRNAVPDGVEPHASPLSYPTTDFRQSPFVVSLSAEVRARGPQKIGSVGTVTVPR